MSVGRAQPDQRSSTVTPLVVSRFAVRIAQHQALPDHEWMRHRAELLCRFTLPSLEHSGWPGLRWALLVDPETLESARRALEPALALCWHTQPVIVRVEGEPYSWTPIAQDLEELRLTTDRVASIRLDTDDALLPGTVERVVRVAEVATPQTLIDLYSGYQYDAQSGRLRTHAKGMQGPFLALVNDRCANPIDAAEFHPKARNDREVRFVHGPSFIQVLHHANVTNTMRRRSLRSRVLSPLAHREGGGIRRAWVLASSNLDVRPPRAAQVLHSCGIDRASSLHIPATSPTAVP